MLCLLSTEESYELLSTKLFNGDTCPKELSVISRFIASGCKGLPLAVFVIAGTLKKTVPKKHSWEQVAKSLIRSHSTQQRLLDILAVPHICSLLYFRKSVIVMDYAGREDPNELVESGALSPRSRNSLSEQVFRNLLSVSRYNLSELVMFGNRFVAVGTRTSLRRHLNYGSILK
ncbi:hypothetical protein ACH5RR_026731 [Cinchona calisaya]|uniref:NB-ARC domain-containing protein n=1 Tax=Cinchona calisaya TaxID=153742 RepID=A0ABD2Z5E6_9GENT